MFGIYAVECGLQFTGKITSTKEVAEMYLGHKYGKVEQVATGSFDENGHPIYVDTFVPRYNKEAFVIKELDFIG